MSKKRPSAAEIKAKLRDAARRKGRAESDLARWLAAAQECPELTMEEAGKAAGVSRTTAHSLARRGRGESPYHEASEGRSSS